MKTTTILLALFALTVLFTSCDKDEDVIPSNNVTTIEKNISGYSKLNVSDPFTVNITFSDSEEKILVEANNNLQAYINVEKQNNWLVIWLDDNVNIDGNSTLNIYITTNNINEFDATGAAGIYLQNDLNTNDIEIDLTGACYFSGTVYATDLNSNLTGASKLNITGEVNSFDIEAAGGSTMEGFDFMTKHFVAELEGASNVSLTVTEDLNVKANGASNVYYKGDGVIESQDLSGGSQIVKME